MSSFKGSQGRSGFRHSKIKWNIFKELLLNNTEGSQRVCRDGSGVFLGEPDYLLHFWRLNVVQGCKTNRGGIWLRLRPRWQECGSHGLRYSLQQRRSCGAGWIPALYFNCSFTVPSQDFIPPSNISDPWTEAAGAGSTGAQTSTVGFWILSLRNPQLEPPNPRPVFHSISPTITCNTCLRTRPTKARVDVNARVLKILGALLCATPYINFSGLILSVHAELSLSSEVQYLMNVFWP